MFIMSVGCGYEQDRGLWDRVFRRHIAASDWTLCKCHAVEGARLSQSLCACGRRKRTIVIASYLLLRAKNYKVDRWTC